MASDNHPFTDSSADILICSSNDVAFRLHKVILSLASDFFRDMFSLSQPTQSTDDLPVLHVSESGQVLENMFRLCYPVDDPPLKTFEEARSTLEVVMKYQMREAFKIVKSKLASFASLCPLRVYITACQLGLEEEASLAAGEVRRQAGQMVYVEELEDLSIGAYHRLLSYCEAQDSVRTRIRFTFHHTGRDPPSSSLSTPLIPPSSLDCDGPDSTETKPAPHPFDMADAEIRILTCDGVDFRVYKTILQLASPVLFSKLPEPATASPTTLITVPEHSRIMSTLLELCYPSSNPSLTDLRDIAIALAAAEKYAMQKATQLLRSALTAFASSDIEDPLFLYAVACRFGMRDLAHAAARRTLRTNIMDAPVADLEALGLSAGCFHRLIEYHSRCRQAAQRACRTFPAWDQLLSQCRRETNPCWFNAYFNILEQEWPTGEFVTSDELLVLVIDYTRFCWACLEPKAILQFVKTAKRLAAAIEADEGAVNLQFGPPARPTA